MFFAEIPPKKYLHRDEWRKILVFSQQLRALASEKKSATFLHINVNNDKAIKINFLPRRYLYVENRLVGSRVKNCVSRGIYCLEKLKKKKNEKQQFYRKWLSQVYTWNIYFIEEKKENPFFLCKLVKINLALNGVHLSICL